MTFLRQDKLDILEQPGSPVIDTLSEVFFSRHYFIFYITIHRVSKWYGLKERNYVNDNNRNLFFIPLVNCLRLKFFSL